MHGGRKSSSRKLRQHENARLAETIAAPGCQVEILGIRPGEKNARGVVSEDEARNTVEVDGMYILQPAHPWWKRL